MKKTKKFKSQVKVIKELAAHFEEDLRKTLPITMHPNGSITYKDYVIIKNVLGNWALYDAKSQDIIEQFYLKTCAIMAAKAYSVTNLRKFFEIKQLDTSYFAHFCDNQIYRINITKTQDYSRYIILLNKLEHSESLSNNYKNKISRMFKLSFV
jgi:hypothetical protein